jgi:putative spermidine/putrescine transport system permease protein
MFTIILKDLLHFNRYDTGFDLYSFLGLSLTYMYFQFPLMVLVISPALDGLKQEWREASENLGASNFQFWRYVALPILMPSLIATIILLFGNAFGAYATAYALTGGNLQLVTIVIGAQIQGDVLHDVGLGNALAITSFILTWVIIGVIQLFSRGTPGQNQLGGVH